MSEPNKYYKEAKIPTRYPNGLPEGITAEIFNRDAAEIAFKLADSTVQIIIDYLDF